MTILFDILLEMGKFLEETRQSTASAGGTTATLIDTTCTEPNDWFNGGVIFFLSGTYSGSSRPITDYNSTGSVFTFSPVLAGATAAGISYAATKGKFSKQALINAVNSALIDIGKYAQYNQTLVTIADTEEYDLPDGISNVTRVQIAKNTTEPYEWEDPLFNWSERGGKLIFDEPFETADLPIRFYYNGFHKEFNTSTTDATEIDPEINKQRLIMTACYWALLSRANYDKSEESKILLKQAEMQKDRLMQMHPTRRMPIDPRYTGF